MILPRFPAPRVFSYASTAPVVRCSLGCGRVRFFGLRPPLLVLFLALEAAGLLLGAVPSGLAVNHLTPYSPTHARMHSHPPTLPPLDSSALQALADADLSSLSLSELCTSAIDAVLEVLKDEEVCDFLARRSILVVECLRA